MLEYYCCTIRHASHVPRTEVTAHLPNLQNLHQCTHNARTQRFRKIFTEILQLTWFWQKSVLIGIHTPNYMINGPNLPYLHVISNECTKPNLHYATFAHRLAKIAQTTAQTWTRGNDSIVAMVTIIMWDCCYSLLLAKPKNQNCCYIFAYFSYTPISTLNLTI